MEWINPKTIIGPPAEGDKYLERPDISNKFWTTISNGEHILFTAPRRVGKSSIMKDLEKNVPDGFIAIYQNVESDNSSKEFYKRIWNLIVDQLSLKASTKEKISKWLKAKKLDEISIDGKIKIENKDLDYKEELLDLIEELGKEKHKIVLMLDEFPDVVNNILNKEGAENAIELLHTMRAIRHEDKFKNFSMVLTGSIGLEHIVTIIDRIKLINDLKRIPVGTLVEKEVDELIHLLLDGATMQLKDDVRKYLKEKISHWLPYFFQLMIAKCNDLAYNYQDPIISSTLIDEAFESIIQENEHFSDWEVRLKKYLPKSDYNYCIGVLTRCAHLEFSLQAAYNFSKEINPDSGYKSLIDDVLEKDGYIVIQDNIIKFLSPFLKAWWQKRHPQYEIEN